MIPDTSIEAELARLRFAVNQLSCELDVRKDELARAHRKIVRLEGSRRRLKKELERVDRWRDKVVAFLRRIVEEA